MAIGNVASYYDELPLHLLYYIIFYTLQYYIPFIKV